MNEMKPNKALAGILLSVVLAGGAITPAVSVFATEVIEPAPTAEPAPAVEVAEVTETTEVIEPTPVVEVAPAVETVEVTNPAPSPAEYPLLTKAKVIIGYREAGTNNDVAEIEEFKVDLGNNFEFVARNIEGYEFEGIIASYGWGGEIPPNGRRLIIDNIESDLYVVVYYRKTPPQPEPKPEPQPEPKPQPKPEPQPEPKPEPKPEPQPEPEEKKVLPNTGEADSSLFFAVGLVLLSFVGFIGLTYKSGE